MTIQVKLVPTTMVLDAILDPQTLVGLFGETVEATINANMDYGVIAHTVGENEGFIRRIRTEVTENLDYSHISDAVLENIDYEEIAEHIGIDIVAQKTIEQRDFKRLIRTRIDEHMSAMTDAITHQIRVDITVKLDEMLLNIPNDICQRVMKMLSDKLVGETDV